MIGFIALNSPVQSSIMDRRITPDEIRKFTSESGKFVLTIASLDHWKTRQAVASLFEGKRRIWTLKLPHSHGPRTASVTNAGVVVLFDEWVNIASDFAITSIPISGENHHVWSYADVQLALGVSNATLNSMAKLGPWLTSLPTVNGDFVQVKAAGMTLTVDTKANRIFK